MPSDARLPPPLTVAALAAAEAEADPSSLAASTRLRRRFPPEVAAAAATQAALRRRARAKFGDAASRMFFTSDGLQQATRPRVAAWRAARLAATGVDRVLDLGCGIGSDALAFAGAGLEVVAVEQDLAAAAVARANLAGRAEVLVADAEAVAVDLLRPGTAVFCDPARRTSSGRVWRVEDFQPRWSFLLDLLDRGEVCCFKLGPALPHALIPDGVEAEWVSDDGNVVEVTLWSIRTRRLSKRCAEPVEGGRTALLLPSGDRMVAEPDPGPLPVGPPLRYLYEPDGAAVRAGLIPQLGRDLGARLLDPQIAYLTSDQRVESPWWTGFEVLEQLPYHERALRAWGMRAGIGTVEIKVRGLDVDPAALRHRLRPSGLNSATLVLTRTPSGARALVCQRL